MTPSFCSEEYWQSILQNSIGCTLGSIVAVLIAVGIYRRQTRDIAIAKSNVEQQEQDNLLRYFFISLDEIVKMLTHQSENISLYIETLKSNPLSNALMTYVPLSSIKRLTDGNLSMEKLLNSYVNKYSNTKDALKTFSEIYAVLDYVYLELIFLPKMIERVLAQDHDRKLKFSEYYKKAWDEVGNFITILSEDDVANIALRKTLDDLSQQRTENDDIKFHHHKFIEPVNTIALEQLCNGRRQFVILTLITRDAKQLFLDMNKHQQSFVTNDLSPILKKAKQETQKLETLIKDLKATYS